MDLHRRHWIWAGLVSAWAWGGGSHAAPASGANKWPADALVVAVPSRYSFAFLPLVLAQRQGFGGLPVQLQFHESGQAALQAVQAGKADVLAGGFEHLFELQHKGEHWQAFVQMTRTPMIGLGVSTRRAPIHSWQDMQGARVGVSALHSGTHWLASLWLARQGVSAQQVHFVEVGSGAGAMGALWEGHVDALCGSDPMLYWLEHRQDVRVVAEARTVLSTQQFFGGPIPGACLMAREDLVSRQSSVLQALTEAVLTHLNWLQTASTVDLFRVLSPPPWLPDRAVVLAALERSRPGFSPDGKMAATAVHNAWRAHVRLTGRDQQPRWPLGRMFTNTLTDRAAQRIRSA